MRKPYPQIKFTNEELKAIDRLSRFTGIENFVPTPFIVLNGRQKKHDPLGPDRFYNTETGRFVSVQYGLKNLFREWSQLKFDPAALTKKERATFIDLMLRAGINPKEAA